MKLKSFIEKKYKNNTSIVTRNTYNESLSEHKPLNSATDQLSWRKHYAISRTREAAIHQHRFSPLPLRRTKNRRGRAHTLTLFAVTCRIARRSSSPPCHSPGCTRPQAPTTLLRAHIVLHLELFRYWVRDFDFPSPSSLLSHRVLRIISSPLFTSTCLLCAGQWAAIWRSVRILQSARRCSQRDKFIRVGTPNVIQIKPNHYFVTAIQTGMDMQDPSVFALPN